tara:strand:- start:491 stop:766 length:276 start_codon:yes stop_codon:yes gene_type:complete
MSRTCSARAKKKLNLRFSMQHRKHHKEITFCYIASVKRRGQRNFEKRLLAFENLNRRQLKKFYKRRNKLGSVTSSYTPQLKYALKPAECRY